MSDSRKNIHLEKLTPENEEEVLELLAKDVLLNLTLIADCTQLRSWCDVSVLYEQENIEGVFSLYSDLSLPAIAFHATSNEKLSILFNTYRTKIGDSDFICICGDKQISMLREICKIEESVFECQMVLPSLSEFNYSTSLTPIALDSKSIPSLNKLYELAGNPAWTPNAIDLGPYYGIVDSSGNILSAAGVHYVTKYAAEVGNVATLPEARKLGYASACVEAVVRDLSNITDTIVLHFFAANDAARKLYENMGFVYSKHNPLYFVRGRY
ncbi:MAG: GNAT family N-acetyltransferase [Candidatus Lokiarchaeota archaeon]|nr:GNAT family N-acetyltransferase [Candidatus Lokiarchaeota archaeon]